MSRAFARKLAASVQQQQQLSVLRRGLCSSAAAAKAPSSTSAAQRDAAESQGKQSFSCNEQPYDIAIVGGGVVGMALACALATKPLTNHLNIAIIDNNPALGSKLSIKREDPPDPRVSTVTPATISLFKDAGAWLYVQQQRHAYFDKMQVWDYTGLGYTKYDARDANKDVLGCVVENKVLQSSLLSCIEDTDFQKTIYPSTLTSMSLHHSSSSTGAGGTLSSTEALHSRERLAKLELSDGRSLYTKLVVGADGAKSQVRQLAGFKTTGWNYSQNAVICTVEHSVENHCAWQRFLPAGPIALLPIGDNYSNIVWTMTPKESSDLTSINKDEFVKAVNHAFDYGYGPHPTSTYWVYASNRVVLIGDAAHAVHPLAGQGVNLGFGDAFSLSRIIAEGITVGTDIGEVSLLKKYEAERKPANVTMMAILDGFQKLYSVDFVPLNVLRAAAFHMAHHISPLKRSIISYASGEQRLPIFS